MSRIQGADPEELNFETIRYTKKDWAATIAFDRPQALNSLNLKAFREVSTALRDSAWDDGVAVVVITGEGDRAFCSGADLKEHRELCNRPRDYHKWISEFIAFQTRLIRHPKPTIARLNGLVIGAGNEINLACDLAVAADDVVIRQAGTSRGSVAAIGVTQWMPLVVGDRRAREALLLCEDIPAAQALEWGLVNRVVPRARLDDEVASLVRSLTEKFSESTRHTKTQTNFWKDLVWGITAGHAADWLAIHSGSPETTEGMQAFVEKRNPDHAAFREKARDDAAPEFHWGPPTGSCSACGAQNLPDQLRYCGVCGKPL